MRVLQTSVMVVALAVLGCPGGGASETTTHGGDAMATTASSSSTDAIDTDVTSTSTSDPANPTTAPTGTTSDDPTTASTGTTGTTASTASTGTTSACVPLDCPAQAIVCGPTDDGCGATLDCGTCPQGQTCTAGACLVTAGLPYPTRDAYQLKALQPDFWPFDDVSGNGAGGVSMNLVWAAWEPAEKPAPCDASEQEYAGRCFVISADVDNSIREYTQRGVVVTAVVYGVPGWARTGHPCSPVTPGFEIFCSPDDPQAFGRFAGMLAARYDGTQDHGRLADFVIHNEVNANDWYDIGCGQGVACDANAWIARYAADWSAAYDAIIAEQTAAKVFISLEHHFASSFDAPGAANPLLGAETFLTGFAAAVGPRPWRVAFHPYPPDLLKPGFSADDLPRVTYGNIGVLLGWLHRNYPGSVAAREVHLTESGVNSIAPNSTPAAQATGVCDSLRNVIATPGIESYVYHRMKDHPVEVASGLGLGLHDEDGAAKPAWATWALANRIDLDPPMLACGFEDLPYLRLRRGYHPQRGHWVSSRLLPPGFTAESAGWRLWRDEQPGTVLLFECGVGEHNLLTTNSSCEGLQPRGPVGWLHSAEQPGTLALRRCRIGNGSDHIATVDPACEGLTDEGVLGWVLPP